MKKILFVTRPIAPPWDEASKNFAYDLAKEIYSSSSKMEIHLLTKGNLPDLPTNIVQHPIYTSSEKDFKLFQKIRSLFFQIKMRSDFDIANYFFTPAKLNSFFIKHLIKNKKTKTVQTVATLREDIFSDKEIKKLMFGDFIITYSDYAKNKLRTLGFKNVRRIYPGIDLENYKPRAVGYSFEKRTAESYIINFTGEYTRLEAIDDVIDSFIKISRKIPEARLSLAARVKNNKDAYKKKEVMDRLRKNNLFNRVMFHDNGKHNMADIYNLCDISIFPVHNMKGKFDVPLAIIEAMACEKPVILSDIPIFQEFANNKNSVIIRSGDTEKLSDAILDLYQNKNKREEIGKNARKYVENNFDIKKIADEYWKIYEGLGK